MEPITQGTCKDFTFKYYNNYLLKNTLRKEALLNENQNNFITSNVQVGIENNKNSKNNNNNVLNYNNNFKYKIYEENLLKEILNNNLNSTNKELNLNQNNVNDNININTINNNDSFELLSVKINNIYNKNKLIEESLDNYSLNNHTTDKDSNKIFKNYTENTNNSFSIMDSSQFDISRQNIYKNKIDLNINDFEGYHFNSQDKSVASNNINFKCLNSEKMYKVSDMNEIYDNNFNLYKENQIFTKMYNKENINQFLTEDKIFNSSNEIISNEDPNSKENLKKIEEQITSLLFSSQKLNSNNIDNKNIFENDSNNDDNNSKELNIILENENGNNKVKTINKNFDKKDNKINKKKSGTSTQLKGKPSLSRLISQLDSMVEKDNNNYNLINSKSKENDNIKKNVNKSNDGSKCFKHSLNNKISVDGIYNYNHVKNTFHNKPLYQETVVKSSKSQYINNSKELIQHDYESSKLKKSDGNLFIQNNNILSNDNEVRFIDKKNLNNNENIKFKKYKRKSFDDNKIRVKNNLEYNKKYLLNHRYSTVNLKTTERACTSEFYDELTDEINKIVNKIKAKPNDLKKRENLFNYIKFVAKKIFPNSRAYKYGSIENGFSLTNGDIDICILNNKEFNNTPAECVEILGEKLKEDGINDIKLLIRARVPIIKMKDNKSGISCDIGFQNRLAIQNTKLINAYSKIDDRFKQMVFIIKYWSKTKNINEPYMGTLSSYCFILMIIHFLQIKEPPVLPNLQKIYLDNFSEYEYIDDFNVSFFENIDELHKYWNGENNESLGELLVEFFKYYANDFPYITGVASIRVGNIITKEEKKWTREHQFEINKSNSVKDRYWFCVEDPFEITHNLGRPVDRKSLFRIRGEFLKAVKIINNKNLNVLQVLEKLLEKNI